MSIILDQTDPPEGFRNCCQERSFDPGKMCCASGEPVALWSEVNPTIDRGEWAEAITRLDAQEAFASYHVGRIMNQGSEGSCAGFMATQALETIIRMTFGMDAGVDLSAMSLYKRTGSGPKSGSGIDENILEAEERGILPLDTATNKARFKHTHSATGYRFNPLPTGWHETGKLFRPHEFYEITTFDEMVSALLSGFVCGYGRKSHAICMVQPVIEGRHVRVKYANSWGATWNGDGFGHDSEALINSRGGLRYYGGWALRTPIHSSVFAGEQ